MNDKIKAKQTLANFASEGYLFGDTETTGVAKSDQAIEITLVDHEGNTVLDTLLKPTVPINPRAQEVHGITEDDLKDAPTWADIHDQFMEAIKGKTVVFYNRSFDSRIIKQTAAPFGKGGIEFDTTVDEQTACAMKPYAVFNGARTARGSYKSIKLVVAAEQEGVAMVDQAGGAHRARYDAILVQRLCKAMAGDTQKATGEVTSF